MASSTSLLQIVRIIFTFILVVFFLLLALGSRGHLETASEKEFRSEAERLNDDPCFHSGIQIGISEDFAFMYGDADVDPADVDDYRRSNRGCNKWNYAHIFFICTGLFEMC